MYLVLYDAAFSLSNVAVSLVGEDAMELFLLSLEEEEKSIREDLQHPADMNLSPEEEQRFSQAHDCWICNKPLGDDRVRDHDHISGDFRGAAHQA